MDNNQIKTYESLYKRKEFRNLDLSDYKITDGEIIHGKKVLVVGIGTARDIRYLLGKNKIWGIDNSTEAVRFSKKLGIKATVGNVEEKLPYTKNYFDIVIIKDVLEHVDDSVSLLKECRRVLNKNGYIVASVPNHFYFPFRIRILFGSNMIWKSIGHDHTKLFDEWNYMHKRFFTWRGFNKMITISGVKIAKSYWDFGTLAHYNQPDVVLRYLSQTKRKNTFLLNVLRLSWKVFCIIFPSTVRSRIVSLSPDLLCAGFYSHLKKK